MKIIMSAVGCMAQVSLIREFQSYGVTVIGIDCDPLSVGFDMCNSYWTLGRSTNNDGINYYVVPKAIDEQFIPNLLAICKKEKPDCIIISPDEEIKVISLDRRKFEALGIKLLIPNKESIKICNDKWLTYNMFVMNGIPTPRTEKYDTLHNLFLPSIIKPRQGRGGYGIFKIFDYEDNIFAHKVKNYIIQEYIEGTEYSIDVLSDWKSNPVSIVIRERVGIESGISTKGKVIHDKQITNYIKKIVKLLNLVGMSCIQGIKDESGIKFTEINLRFGGGSVLSRRADPTIVNNYLRLIRGEKLLKVKEPRLLTMLRYYSEVIK